MTNFEAPDNGPYNKKPGMHVLKIIMQEVSDVSEHICNALCGTTRRVCPRVEYDDSTDTESIEQYCAGVRQWIDEKRGDTAN